MSTTPILYMGEPPTGVPVQRVYLNLDLTTYAPTTNVQYLGKVTLTVTPNVTGAGVLPGGEVLVPRATTMDVSDGSISFYAVDSNAVGVNPHGWNYSATLRVDRKVVAKFTFSADSTTTNELNLATCMLFDNAITGEPTVVGRGVLAMAGVEQSDGTEHLIVTYTDGTTQDLGALVTGPAGPATNLTIGTVTTGAPGTQAQLTISGTPPNQVLNITIPAGQQGNPGQASSLSIGTVGTSAPGTAAQATITGEAPNQALNLEIPQGLQGNDGPPNTLSMGTVTTGGVGTQASATITGTAPNQALNLTIPQGASGGTGPANTLAMGTVTTGAAGSQASATITGTSPNQTLNLTLPKGDPGANNTLSMGTVTTGAAGTQASASITGTSPNQTLSLTIPKGDQGNAGPVNTLAMGTVNTGAAGAQAAASITGTAPNQTLNLTIPQGQPGTNATNPNFSVSASTLAPGSSSTASISGTYPNLTIALGLARGATGNPTSFELRGTGSPYGVVTPASAGIYYTDTAGTTGAWRWMSTGTTNTSWVVVFGDTGWRDIFSVLTNVPAGISGAFGVRRIGGQVFVRTLLTSSNTAVTMFSTAIPAGFGRVTTVGPQPYPAFIASLGRQDNTPYATNSDLAWDGSNMRIRLALNTDLQMVPDGTFWHTSDAWPTTLPGTPA